MDQKTKDPGAVAMAKKRAASMTPERRSEDREKGSRDAVGNKKKKKSTA